MTSKGSVTVSVSVPYEMNDWMQKPQNKKKHNYSAIFQAQIKHLMNPGVRSVSPLMLLSSVMGIVFGTCLMLTSIGLGFWLGVMVTTMLFLLGVATIFITIMMFVRERRDIVNARTL